MNAANERALRKTPHTVCGSCGTPIDKAVAIYDEKAYCRHCYSKLFEKMECPTCSGSVRQPAGTAARPCEKCRIQSRRCIRCHKPVPRAGRLIDGQVVCPACVWFYKEPQNCPNCGKLSKRLARDLRLGFDEPVCESCRRKDHRTCAQCGKDRRVAAYDHEGRPLCKTCVGSNGVFICPQCNKPGKRHSRAKCQQCYWRELGGQRLMKIDAALRNDWLRHEFRLFFDDLSVHRNPQRAALMITKYGEFFAALDGAVTISADLSYELLAQLFWNHGLHRHKVAISFLIRRGLLAEMKANEWSEFLEALRQRRILENNRDAPHYKLLLEYEEFLQHRVRSNRKFNWISPNERPKARTVTNNLAAANHFLTFVGAKTTDDLRQLHQNTLDKYLYENRGYRDAIRPFVWYLNKIVRVFKQLEIPPDTKGIRRGLILPEVKVSELLARWLCADGADARPALMGLLMLFYCQQPSTIVPIKLTDIQVHGNDTAQITIRRTFIEVESNVGQVLRRYLAARHVLCLNEKPWENPFLFPGQLARSHVSPGTIGYLMKHFEVSPEQLFATGVSNAFLDGVPSPKILVESTGITLPTAMKYFYAQNPMQANYVKEHLANK